MRVCLDTSVIVKWFKDGERCDKEAKLFRDKIISSEINAVINEYAQLELIRALVKAGFSKKKIRKAQRSFNELVDSSSILILSVSSVLNLARDLQIDHSLYSADSVHLVTAITSSSNVFLVDDKHFLRLEIIKMAREHGVMIKHLAEIQTPDPKLKENPKYKT